MFKMMQELGLGAHVSLSLEDMAPRPCAHGRCQVSVGEVTEGDREHCCLSHRRVLFLLDSFVIF